MLVSGHSFCRTVHSRCKSHHSLPHNTYAMSATILTASTFTGCQELSFRRHHLAKNVAGTIIDTPAQLLTDIPPEELCRLFVTAHDVSIICACKRCFSDIAQRSLKIMSPAATKPDVAVAFLLAYPFGCKALTVYRRSNKVFSCNLSHPSRISSLCMRNSSTELTPLRDGDRYFHRLEYVR